MEYFNRVSHHLNLLKLTFDLALGRVPTIQADSELSDSEELVEDSSIDQPTNLDQPTITTTTLGNEDKFIPHFVEDSDNDDEFINYRAQLLKRKVLKQKKVSEIQDKVIPDSGLNEDIIQLKKSTVAIQNVDDLFKTTTNKDFIFQLEKFKSEFNSTAFIQHFNTKFQMEPRLEIEPIDYFEVTEKFNLTFDEIERKYYYEFQSLEQQKSSLLTLTNSYLIHKFFTQELEVKINNNEKCKKIKEVVIERSLALIKDLNLRPELISIIIKKIHEILIQTKEINIYLYHHLLYQLFLTLIEQVANIKLGQPIQCWIRLGRYFFSVQQGHSEFVLLARFVLLYPHLLNLESKEMDESKKIELFHITNVFNGIFSSS